MRVFLRASSHTGVILTSIVSPPSNTGSYVTQAGDVPSNPRRFTDLVINDPASLPVILDMMTESPLGALYLRWLGLLINTIKVHKAHSIVEVPLVLLATVSEMPRPSGQGVRTSVPSGSRLWLGKGV